MEIKITYDELSGGKGKELIEQRKSFEIIDLTGIMSKSVDKIENIIESNGLSCRIYTYARVASAGATLFGGVTGLAGLASVVGMAAHNLVTINPDYEIAKHIIDHKLTVSYCHK